MCHATNSPDRVGNLKNQTVIHRAYLRCMSREEKMRGFCRPADSPNTDSLKTLTMSIL